MTSQVEKALASLRNLTPLEKLEVIEQLTASIKANLREQPEESQTNPLLMMAEAAEKLGLSADRDDISENFDDVLRETWGKHLEQKWQRDE